MPLHGTTTRSIDSENLIYVSLKASLTKRFTLFLTTAFLANFLDTDNPKRPIPLDLMK